jgi:sporulation protein YlmC with PRC-barrel domain
MSQVALSELLGAAVRDSSGAVKGRVRDIAIAPQEHATRVAFLIVRTPGGERVLPGVETLRGV